MNEAALGDTVQAISCHCGTQLVAMWGVPTWSCPACKHSGHREGKYRLLDVGFEPITPASTPAFAVNSGSPKKGELGAQIAPHPQLLPDLLRRPDVEQR